MRSLAWGGPCDTDTAGDVQWLSENDLALEYKNRFLNRIDRTMAGNTLRMFPWHVCLQSITTTKEVLLTVTKRALTEMPILTINPQPPILPPTTASAGSVHSCCIAGGVRDSRHIVQGASRTAADGRHAIGDL